MKPFFVILVSLLSLSSSAQFDKSLNLMPVINFNIVMKGLGQNDAGAGLGLNASLFSKRRLQMLVEANTDRFIGDKNLRIDTVTGKKAKNAIIYNVKVGAQYFPINALSISVTYGPSWYLVRDFEYTLEYGFKYSATGYLGDERRVILRLSLIEIPKEHTNIKYLLFGIGYRL